MENAGPPAQGMDHPEYHLTRLSAARLGRDHRPVPMRRRQGLPLAYGPHLYASGPADYFALSVPWVASADAVNESVTIGNLVVSAHGEFAALLANSMAVPVPEAAR